MRRSCTRFTVLPCARSAGLSFDLPFCRSIEQHETNLKEKEVVNLPKVENFSQLFLKEKLSGAKAEPAKAELVQSESRTAEKRPAKSAQSEGSKRTRQAANGRAKAPKE